LKPQEGRGIKHVYIGFGRGGKKKRVKSQSPSTHGFMVSVLTRENKREGKIGVGEITEEKKEGKSPSGVA